MKKILFLLLIISCSCVFAQVSRTKLICNREGLMVYLKIEEVPNVGNDSIFIIRGSNKRYKYINDDITISRGSAQDVYDFLVSLKLFAEKYENDYDVVEKKGDLRFSRVYAAIGKGGVSISNDRGYTNIRYKAILKLIDEFVEYTSKNNIQLKL